jgi:hypothetical protein
MKTKRGSADVSVNRQAARLDFLEPTGNCGVFI